MKKGWRLYNLSERSPEAHKAVEKKMMELEKEIAQQGIKGDVVWTAWEECAEYW